MTKDKGKSGGKLVIGGPARANLLPPEVGVAAHGRVVRRNAVAVIILAIIVVVVGYVGAMAFALAAQVQLDAANERTQVLLAKQGEFTEVRSVKSLLETATAARIAATSTEIDWQDYLAQIQNILPAGTIVTNVTASTATPLSSFSVPSVPLQGDRIGELTFTATSVSLPDVESWLHALAKLPGYVDASPGSVVLQSEGAYQVNMTMHINKDVLLLRFDDVLREARDKALADEAAKSGKEPTPPPAPTETQTPTPTPTPTENIENPDATEGGVGNE